MLERRRQVRHDGGGKVPTVSQGRGQLMADTAAQAGFGHSDGQVVLPNEVRHGLFVVEFIYAKDGLPKALPNLGVQRLDESGRSGFVGSFGSQAHVNLAQLHLR